MTIFLEQSIALLLHSGILKFFLLTLVKNFDSPEFRKVVSKLNFSFFKFILLVDFTLISPIKKSKEWFFSGGGGLFYEKTICPDTWSKSWQSRNENHALEFHSSPTLDSVFPAFENLIQPPRSFWTISDFNVEIQNGAFLILSWESWFSEYCKKVLW